jgi:uncharacterized membrane protein
MAAFEEQRAKRPVSMLAGPYGHPFHPIAVTVPIGAWVCAFVFDLVSLGSDQPDVWATGARWLIGIGVIGALVAAVLGFLDLVTIPNGTTAQRTALTHMALNVTVLVLFVVSFFLRSGRTDEQTSVGLLLLSIVALALLGASGWLGGKLAYHFGVRVADESTQAEGFLRAHQPGDRG